MIFQFKAKNKKLDIQDVVTFYAMQNKFNKLSDIVGVVSKDFKEALKYVKKKYDKTYTIIANDTFKSILVVKEDFLEKYIIIDTLDDLSTSQYKFYRYI